MRKVDYRLKRDFYPMLESDGFVRSGLSPREWVKVENGIGCALMIYPTSKGLPDSPHRVGEEGLLVEVAIKYPMSDSGDTVMTLEQLGGVGSGDKRGQLQRTEAPRKTPIGFEWDLGMMTADEAVTDIVAAYKDAGRAFYNLWTDPEKAWAELHSEYEEEYESDVGGVYFGGPHWQRTIAKIVFFMKVAGRVGLIEEEIDLLHQLRAANLKALGIDKLGDRYAARLRELERIQRSQ